MRSIDFQLQDFIFHQMIKKNRFNQWNQKWTTNIRDLKPVWLHNRSEFYLRSKNVYLDEITERLVNIKNKKHNLFGNINVNNQIVTLNYEKNSRAENLFASLGPDLKRKFETETEELGNFTFIFLFFIDHFLTNE